MSTVAEIRSNLQVAARLRIPPLYDDLVPPDERFDPARPVRLSPQARIESYEDFIVKAATYRGELEEDLLTIQSSIKDLEDEWEAIEGWETLVDPGDKTQRASVDAKRKLRPDLYSGIREGKWLADKLRVQVKRLEQDEGAASRLYTMLTGS
jgi:hypothetical protein